MPEPLRVVDTNVVLRYLLADIPDQAERARKLIDSDRPLGLTAEETYSFDKRFSRAGLVPVAP